MKRFLRKVSLKRFKGWSTPSQLTYLIYLKLKKNRLITITGLVMSFISIYFNVIQPKVSSFILNKKAKKVEANLMEYQKSKDWFSYSSTLYENKDVFNTEDWYNYHRCINSFHSNSSITTNNNHLLYFKKINSESVYYGMAIKGIIANYRIMKNKNLSNKKMSSLITLIKNDDYSEPEYYLSLILAFGQSAPEEYIYNVYKEIKEDHPKIFNKPAGNISFNIIKEGMSKDIDIKKLSKLYGVTFMCSYLLSKNTKISNEIRNDLIKMFPSTNEYMTAEYGMSLLNINISERDKRKYKDFVNSLSV